MPLSSEEIDRVIEVLETAAEENKVSSLRAAQVVNLPADGEVWVTGDLHDHRRNFEAFIAGVKRDFGSRRHLVQVAITELLLSFPLAIRTANGLWFSHSIPGDDEIPTYDYTVFERELTGEDYRRRVGPVYQLVWGRE